MHAVMNMRRHGPNGLGGDVVQVVETSKALRELGILTTVSESLSAGDVRQADVVHLFNLTRPGLLLEVVRLAQQFNKPVVLSPIFVDYTASEIGNATGVRRVVLKVLGADGLERAKALARWCRGDKSQLPVVLKGNQPLEKAVLGACKAILPNSFSELSRLRRAFDSVPTATVVPNGVNLDGYRMSEDDRRRWDWATGFVACIGRIELLKNQLNVVRAMKGLPYRLILAGPISSNQRRYGRRVLAELKQGGGYYVGILTHNEVLALLSATRVHVLASWAETTGLVNLEAAVAGNSLVVGEYPDVVEYLGGDAMYCNPASVSSIRRAIVGAYQSAPSEDLVHRIVSDYTWRNAARVTAAVYDAVADG